MTKRNVAFGRAVAVVALCAATAGAQTPPNAVSAQTQPQTVAAAQAQTPTSRQVSNALERGYQLLKRNRKNEARAAFSKVLAQEPQNHAALIELGYIEAGQKHWKSAVKYLSIASEQDPANQRLHMDLGYAYQALKDYPKAGSEFQTVAQEPGEFQIQAQSALQVVQTTQATPNNSKEARMMTQAYGALATGNRTLARQRLEAVLAQNPQNVSALKQLGFLELSQGKVSAAAQRFEAARQADPNDYFASLQLGYIYQRQRKTPQAQEAFNAALASPDPQIHGAAQAALVSTGGEPAKQQSQGE